MINLYSEHYYYYTVSISLKSFFVLIKFIYSYNAQRFLWTFPWIKHKTDDM